jgi:cell cycle sensor histidine kinase DivJ
LRIGVLINGLGAAFRGLVHASIPQESNEAGRHALFISGHLAGGILALGLVLPVLAFGGGAAAFPAIALALFGLQALAALFVAKTGRLAAGSVIAAGLFAAFLLWFTAHTGGLGSFALIWFLMVPLEAALFGDRRSIVAAGGMALASIGVLAAIAFSGLQPAPAPAGTTIAFVAALAAVAYGSWLALHIGRSQAEAHRELLAGEERYHLLADVMGEIVTCHDGRGDVTYASPAVARLCGLAPLQLQRDGLFRLVHLADRPAFLRALSEALHTGNADAEYRMKRLDEAGHEQFIWVETSFRRTAEQRPGAAVVGVTRDIHRRKDQQAEILSARSEADRANAAKTRFLANMSHELRTPLNAIIGFSDMLAQETFGGFQNERQREYVRLIHESGEHLLTVVNDILDMSKIEAGSFSIVAEPFHVGEAIHACVRLMSQQAEMRGVRLVTATQPGLPELPADRRAVKQILLNLLSNAVKFTDAGGEVACGARLDGNGVAIFVRDSGIGIGEADLPRLGQPFVQADSGYDRRREGTGLGLSVVKGLTALHGGHFSIESRLGHGTTVTVRLPLSDAATARVDTVELAGMREAKRA